MSGGGDTVPAKALLGAAVGDFGLLKDMNRNTLRRAGEQVVEVGFDGVGIQ
jgi:hypothetical protein